MGTTVNESPADLGLVAAEGHKWGAIFFIAFPLAYLLWKMFLSISGAELTFGYTNNAKGVFPSPELWAIVVPAIYIAALNAIRLLMVLAMAAFGRTKEIKEPAITSYMLKRGALVALIGYGGIYLFWLLNMKHSGGQTHGPFLAFLVMNALSVLMVLKQFMYGFTLDKRSSPLTVERVHTPQAKDTEYNSSRATVPSITFADIVGNSETKARLLKAAKKVTESYGEERQRNGILLDGPPGNGKTVFAEALAGELGLPLITLTSVDAESKWVGEKTMRIRASFEAAKRQQPCLFFIDEIDSMIPDRNQMDSTVNKEERDIVNAMLTLLVDIRKSQVIVVAATNYVEKLDPAATREGRFDFKVEIKAPDEEARIGLLRSGLKKNLRNVSVEEATILNVAARWNGFSAKRILAVTEELPGYLDDLKDKGEVRKSLSFDDFMVALRRIQGTKGEQPENVKDMSELILPAVTREAIEMIAGRLRDPVRVERLGGTMPTGVLFHGPAGTGKTTVAKALAKSVGSAFLPATGTDLARDPKALERLYAKAKELRPTIIFIDEADDLLRSREFSGSTEATNKLLTLMDGVSDRVRDIVWVAATNHPDQIDEALLRGGRFTEKIEFVRPNESQLLTHVRDWIAKRKVVLGSGLSVEGITQQVGEQSIANAEAVLQYAVNRAISNTTGDIVQIAQDDIDAGVSVVLG